MGEIMHNAHQLIIGGSETTATALSGITYLLATHKQVLQRLKEEVKANFGHEDEITFVNVQKLDYMMAVIREALRIYPPVPSALPRRAPPSGIMIGDRWVPPNVGSSHLTCLGLLTDLALDRSWPLAVAHLP